MPIGNQIQYTDNVASKIVSATATSSQTTFNILDGYRVNAIAVYKQGLRLSNGVDFTATDGSTVVLTSGASADDKMVFQIYDDFSVADISAAPGDFTVGGDLGVSGTLSGDGSGLTGVASTDNVSTSSLNVVGVATIAIDASVGRNFEVLAGVSTFAGIVNASKDVRVTRNLNVTGVSTLTGYVGLSTGLTVAGVSTLTGKVIAEGALDLKGQTNHLAGSEHILMPSGGLLFQHNPGSGSENVLLMHTDYCKLYQGNTLRLETTTSGITVTGVSAFTEDVRISRNLNAGIITATTFVGALTGNASGTAGGLSGTPSITVQDITAEMVSIGGTLTYEDVTQIDSVGIITAQQDVRVGRNFNVTGISTATLDVRVGRNLNVTGVSTFSGSIGNVTVGIVTATKFDGPGVIPAGQTGTVTLAASDAGKHVAATGTVTLGTGIFAVGDAVTIWNNSAGAITITLSAVTCYNAADGTTGNRTLGARGLATILCTASNTYVISGAGLS